MCDSNHSLSDFSPTEIHAGLGRLTTPESSDSDSDDAKLTAGKFVESGFANPVRYIDEGKRVEKVSIAKSGNSYISKRENEPTLPARFKLGRRSGEIY